MKGDPRLYARLQQEAVDRAARPYLDAIAAIAERERGADEHYLRHALAAAYADGVRDGYVQAVQDVADDEDVASDPS